MGLILGSNVTKYPNLDTYFNTFFFFLSFLISVYRRFFILSLSH